MSKRVSLREFQEGLVRRLADAQSATRRDLLGLSAGDQNWLIDLADAGEILPPPTMAPVPLTRSWFRGLANVRGTLFGIVDLSVFCGSPTTNAAGGARLVLIGQRHGSNCGLLVGSTTGLRSPDDFETVNGSTPPFEWVSHSLRDTHGRIWHHIDVVRLLGHPAFLEASAA